MQTNTFWLEFGGLNLAVTLKIRSRSPTPIQLFIMSKCYIHVNLVKICQLVHEILGTKAPFGSNLVVSGEELNKHCCFRSNPAYCVELCMYCTFTKWNKYVWTKFGSLSPAVTLKNRSRSPKPNQLFIMSQCYIQANLVEICQSIHEIWCIQALLGLNLAV